MRKILAIDAGGTSTRAVILDLSGRCLGYGRAGSGNPTAAGIDGAAAELGRAAERAVAADSSVTDPGSSATVSLAGTISPRFSEQLAGRFTALGFTGDPVIEPDLLGTYYSGTFRDDGYALIVGTGAVAGRMSRGRLDLTRGGTGWLLGDAGSGFWIGHRIARAVVAALDGLGPETAMAAMMLNSLEITTAPGTLRGRPLALIRLMEELYALRPVDLARFAPIAFDVPEDPVARGILTEAAVALAELLEATHDPSIAGPIVLGGSVLAAAMRAAPSIFADRLMAAVGGAELLAVPDGVVGAAVLGLRHAGVSVESEIFARIQDGVARLRMMCTQAEAQAR